MTIFEEKYLNKRVIIYSEQLSLRIYATIFKIVPDNDDAENAFFYFNSIQMIDGNKDELPLFRNMEGDYAANLFEIESVIEPAFPRGLWIRNTKYKNLRAIQAESFYWSLTENDYAYKSKGSVYYEKDVIEWMPQEDELCLFELKDIAILAKFSHFDEEGKCRIKSDIDLRFDYCEPFIGSKPSYWI